MTTSTATTLDLPLPPSKNELPMHEMARIRAENRYKRLCWAKALGQAVATTDPPEMVRARVHFRIGATWDRANLWTAWNLVADAISRPPPGGPPPPWRLGIAERKGLIRSDAPRNLEVVGITQEVERAARRRGVRVVLETADAPD